MCKTNNLCLPLILSLILCVSAAGQQPMTQKQIHQVNKIKRMLAHFETGTKLDVQLNNGSHQIGTLSQAGSTSFAIVDPVSSKPEAIDYVNVKRVHPSRKEYFSQQFGKTASGLPKVAGIALLTVAAIVVLWVVVKSSPHPQCL